MQTPDPRIQAAAEAHAAAVDRQDVAEQLADEIDAAPCSACGRAVNLEDECFDEAHCDECRCDHTWEFVRDWMGDPNVINGTADCSFWRCTKCETETEDKPEGWQPPMPEYAREEAW